MTAASASRGSKPKHAEFLEAFRFNEMAEYKRVRPRHLEGQSKPIFTKTMREQCRPMAFRAATPIASGPKHSRVTP